MKVYENRELKSSTNCHTKVSLGPQAANFKVSNVPFPIQGFSENGFLFHEWFFTPSPSTPEKEGETVIFFLKTPFARINHGLVKVLQCPHDKVATISSIKFFTVHDFTDHWMVIVIYRATFEDAMFEIVYIYTKFYSIIIIIFYLIIFFLICTMYLQKRVCICLEKSLEK